MDSYNAVSREAGSFHWSVVANRRTYTARYRDDEDIFPPDRWDIRNSRGQRCAWDSRAAIAVKTLIVAFEHAMGAR